MATIQTYSPEYSDQVRKQNIDAATGGKTYVIGDPVQLHPDSNFGFNTTPTKTVGTVAVDPEYGSYLNKPTPTTAPSTNIASELERIKNEALAIQAKLPTATEPTIGETFSGVSFDPEYPTYDELYGEEPDPNQIYKDKLKQFQVQIDATNQVYDQLLSQARLEGQGRLGTGRAISARGGLLGSDFGEAQRQGIITHNTGIEKGVEAERTAAIGAILGEVRSSVQEEIKLKNEARQQGAQNYISYLAGQQERRAANTNKAAQAFLNQGIDPTTLSPEELNAIAKEGGITTNDIINEYRVLQSAQATAAAESDLETRKTEAEIAKIEADIESGKLVKLGEGDMLYDPETGETFKNPKTYAPGTKKTSLSIPGIDLTEEQIAGVHQLLTNKRDSSGYTPVEEYMKEMNIFVSLGGDPKDFIKEYNPDIYVNPSDPNISFLKSQMRKESTGTDYLGELIAQSLATPQ